MKKLVFTAMVAIGFVLCMSVKNSALADVPVYDPSVFMPVPKLCPSGMSYYTACEELGIGCNPDGCHDDVD